MFGINDFWGDDFIGGNLQTFYRKSSLCRVSELDFLGFVNIFLVWFTHVSSRIR